MILYFFEHHKNLTFRQKWIFNKWSASANFTICSGSVYCCECHQSSYILCEIDFEDNTLLRGENDRIAKQRLKRQRTTDQKYQLIWKWNQIWIGSPSDYLHAVCYFWQHQHIPNQLMTSCLLFSVPFCSSVSVYMKSTQILNDLIITIHFSKDKI